MRVETTLHRFFSVFKFSSNEHVPAATLFSLPPTSPSDMNCEANVSGETNDKMQQAIIRAF